MSAARAVIHVDHELTFTAQGSLSPDYYVNGVENVVSAFLPVAYVTAACARALASQGIASLVITNQVRPI